MDEKNVGPNTTPELYFVRDGPYPVLCQRWLIPERLNSVFSIEKSLLQVLVSAICRVVQTLAGPSSKLFGGARHCSNGM